ncbi:MAG: hypothetical protein V1929_12310 [bacterium]
MKKFFAALFVGLTAVGACVMSVWIMDHHIIQTPKGVVVVSKRFLAWKDSYIDIRSWSYAEFEAKPDIEKVLVVNGYSDLVYDIQLNELRTAIDDLSREAELKANLIKKEFLESLVEWLHETEESWFPSEEKPVGAAGAAS